MTIQEFIKKLQGLSEGKKIVIIATVLIISTGVLGFFWVKSSIYNISKIADSAKSINFNGILPNTQVNLPDIASVVSPSDAKVLHDSAQNSDWKTYANTKYGFEVKYPGDWPVPVENTPKNRIDFNGKVLITYYKNDKDLPGNFVSNFSLDVWLVKNKYSYLDKATIKNVTFGDNYPAIALKESYCKGTPFSANAYFVLKDAGSVMSAHTDIYQIEGPLFKCSSKTISQDYDSAEKVFNQMLSTFKFTN